MIQVTRFLISSLEPVRKLRDAAHSRARADLGQNRDYSNAARSSNYPLSTQICQVKGLGVSTEQQCYGILSYEWSKFSFVLVYLGRVGGYFAVISNLCFGGGGGGGIGGI